MRAVSKLKDGINLYDVQLAPKESSKHNIRGRTQQNTNQSTVISNSISNALKSLLDCIPKKFLSLNDDVIRSSASDISWVRVRVDKKYL